MTPCPDGEWGTASAEFNNSGAMHNVRPLTRRLAAGLAFCIALSFGAARGEDDYVSARELAKAHGLTCTDISHGTMRGCRLTGEGRSATLFADLRSVMIDGAVVRLSRPVTWNGSEILLPSEAAGVIVQRFDKPPEDVPTIHETTARPPLRKRDFKIVLDPGHGGTDPGAVGASGLYESTVNLDIAKRLARKLQAKGIAVTMTRDRDVFVDLNIRAAIANRARPDLFMSIHANAVESSRPHGALTIYPDEVALANARDDVKRNGAAVVSPRALGTGGPVTKTALLAAAGAALDGYYARSIQATRIIQAALLPVTGTHGADNGVVMDERGLRVLRKVRCPAVLVEVDFLSNRNSERRLRTSEYRERIADALAEAVEKYFNRIAEEME